MIRISREKIRYFSANHNDLGLLTILEMPQNPRKPFITNDLRQHAQNSRICVPLGVS